MTDLETADALQMAGEGDAAAEGYRRVIAADPDNAAAWHGLGGARLRACAYGEASDALLEAVRLQPDEASAWGQLAEALFYLGDVERAVEACRRAAADPALQAMVEQNIAIMSSGSAVAANADVLAARRASARHLVADLSPVRRPPRPPS